MNKEVYPGVPTVEPGLRVGQAFVWAAESIVTAERIPLPDCYTTDPRELQERAERLETVLGCHVERNTSVAVTKKASRINNLGAAIAAGDLDGQAEYGLDLRGVRFDVLARQIIMGNPVELQPTSLAVYYSEQSNELDAAVVGISTIMRRIVEFTGGAMRTNAITHHDPEHVGIGEASDHIMRLVMNMRSSGMLRPTDVLGRDVRFSMLALGDVEALEPLKKGLDESRYGAIQTLNGALTTFMPHPKYVQLASRISNLPAWWIAKTGLPLHFPNVAFDQAVIALDSLSKEPDALRINLECINNNSAYHRAAALSRFAGGIGLELSQLILYEPGRDIPAQMASLALSSALLPHVRQLRRNWDRFASPERYNARQYYDHNYGKGVLEEQMENDDEPIIEGMLNEDFHCRIRAIEELGDRYQCRQFGVMVDAYCGPASSMARMLAPYIKDSILELDVSPSAIELQQQWIDGTLSPENAATARRDQELFDRSVVAGRYTSAHESIDEVARMLATAKIGDFVDLEPASCDFITDGYGTCSSGIPQSSSESPSPLPPTFEDFCTKQRIKYRALRPGGATLSMHMVRRFNWEGEDVETGEPIELPSIYLMSAEEVEKAYLDAGFVNVFVTVIEVPNPHHKGQSEQVIQDAAMAVVIGDKPHEK